MSNTDMTADRDHVLSEHHACPECGGGEFLIIHRAGNVGDVIRCADEDCYATWTLAPRFFSCPFRPQVTTRR
jgi:ribosomal protein S27AE